MRPLEQPTAAMMKQAYEHAALALPCDRNASCYVKLLGEPIPDAPSASWKQIKAAYMAAELGDDGTRDALVQAQPCQP